MLGAFFLSKRVAFDDSVWASTECGTLLIKLKIVENFYSTFIHTCTDIRMYQYANVKYYYTT